MSSRPGAAERRAIGRLADAGVERRWSSEGEAAPPDSPEVEDVRAAAVPAAPNLTTEPTTSPAGSAVTTASDELSGEVEVVLTDDSGSRTLLSAHGPGKYTYAMRAFWAPNWQWIAADDGRILVITTDDPSTTRVLVDDPRGGRSDRPLR